MDGRQADQSTHRYTHDGHGRDQRMLHFGIYGSEYASHKCEEQQRNNIAGDQERFAADVESPLQRCCVEEGAHVFSSFVNRIKSSSREPRSIWISVIRIAFFR